MTFIGVILAVLLPACPKSAAEIFEDLTKFQVGMEAVVVQLDVENEKVE